MFGNADSPDEERLECMVKLLQTCGKKLDQTGSPETAKVHSTLHNAIYGSVELQDRLKASSRNETSLRPFAAVLH